MELFKIKQLLISKEKVNHELALQLAVGQNISLEDLIDSICEEPYCKEGFPFTHWIKGFRSQARYIKSNKSLIELNEELLDVKDRSRRYLEQLIKDSSD